MNTNFNGEEMNFNVLIADDDQRFLNTLNDRLRNHLDINPTIVSNSVGALELVKENPDKFALIVLDFHFDSENTTGPEITKKLKAINQKILVIVLTNDESGQAARECWHAGAEDIVYKGNLELAIQQIRNYCNKYEETMATIDQDNGPVVVSKQKNRMVLDKLGIVGCSDEMAEIAETIIHIGETGSKCSVLIRGESGTGKELIAKAIHDQSDRKDRKFIAFNAGALKGNLLKSELFGHVKGAFTDASMTKIGKLKLADGGTVFLDEVGDIEEETQVLLLRFLQEGTFTPEGSNDPVKVDVRIIAATNKPMPSPSVREDFYYRLNTIEFFLPPLRKRSEDIRHLVRHFMMKHKKGREIKMRNAVIPYFMKYQWPGNIRELENIIERLIDTTKGKEITPENLPSCFFDENNIREEYSNYSDLQGRMDEMERRYFLSVIRNTNDEISLTKILPKAGGMSKATLARKLIKLGIDINKEKETIAGQL